MMFLVLRVTDIAACSAGLEKEEDKEVEDSPTADAAKRSQIREVMQHDSSQPKFDSIIDCLFYKVSAVILQHLASPHQNTDMGLGKTH